MKISAHERNYDYVIAQKTAIEAAAAEAIAQQQAMAKPSEGIAQRQAEEQAILQSVEEPESALSVVETQGSYVSGTCKALKLAASVATSHRAMPTTCQSEIETTLVLPASRQAICYVLLELSSVVVRSASRSLLLCYLAQNFIA